MQGDGLRMKIARNKRASLETKEIIELVIGAAAIVLLIWLMWGLISPSFDKNKKTAESYLSSLQDSIKEVDEGANSSIFNIWQPKVNVMMVLFGNGISMNSAGELYKTNKLQKNQVCFCYSKSKAWVCDACTSLAYPVQSKYVAFGAPNNVKITKDNTRKVYVFETL